MWGVGGSLGGSVRAPRECLRGSLWCLKGVGGGSGVLLGGGEGLGGAQGLLGGVCGVFRGSLAAARAPPPTYV